MSRRLKAAWFVTIDRKAEYGPYESEEAAREDYLAVRAAIKDDAVEVRIEAMLA